MSEPCEVSIELETVCISEEPDNGVKLRSAKSHDNMMKMNLELREQEDEIKIHSKEHPLRSSESDATVDQLKGVSLAKRVIIKVGYGMGEAGCYLVSAIQGFFMSSFLLEVAQLDANLSGVVILSGECFDAVSDPLIGKLSDQTRTRFGRRRPWLFVSFSGVFFA
jgi:hypothetical protein